MILCTHSAESIAASVVGVTPPGDYDTTNTCHLRVTTANLQWDVDMSVFLTNMEAGKVRVLESSPVCLLEILLHGAARAVIQWKPEHTKSNLL